MTGRPQSFRWSVLTCLGLAACVGCGRSSAVPTIQGRVTINGTPVKQGEIELAPVDGQGSVASGSIVDGQYTLTTSLGPKQVLIQAYEQAGSKPLDPAMPGSAMVPVMKPLLPEKYNTASELTLEVVGDAEKNFEISLP